MCDEVACGADALQDAMQLEIQHGRSRSKREKRHMGIGQSPPEPLVRARPSFAPTLTRRPDEANHTPWSATPPRRQS